MRGGRLGWGPLWMQDGRRGRWASPAAGCSSRNMPPHSPSPGGLAARSASRAAVTEISLCLRSQPFPASVALQLMMSVETTVQGLAQQFASGAWGWSGVRVMNTA